MNSGRIFIFRVCRGLRAAPNAFSQKGDYRLPVFLYGSSRENGITERPQTLRYPEIINNDSSEYAQSAAEGIPNCLRTKKTAVQKYGSL